MTKDVAIGIDLGTTYCCCAVYRDGEVEVIPNSFGKNTTPSYVTLTIEENFVGEVSKKLAFENPHRTIYDVKRLIGRKFVDPRVQRDMIHWPFKVCPENLLPKIQIDSSTYFPEEISALLLTYLRECAEDYLSQPISKVVITVPAYFNDSQRQATRDAGKIAGLDVIRIINEPTSAAIAYNFYKKNSDQNSKKHYLIFDLGGGTFDVAILSMQRSKIDVISVDGHNHLGGEDFDNAMTNYCIEQFKLKHKVDLNEKRRAGRAIEQTRAVRAMRRLKTLCEEQKKLLSASKRARVGLTAFYEGKDLNVPFDRELFNRLNEKKFQQCLGIVRRALDSSGMTKDDLSAVVLVGGSSRIPRIQEILTEYFGSQLISRIVDPDPEEAVAYGASIVAYQEINCRDGNNNKVSNLSGINSENHENVIRQITISDVTPLPISIDFSKSGQNQGKMMDDDTGVIVITRNTKIPCCRVFQYKISDEETDKEWIPFSIFEGQNNTSKYKKRSEKHLIGNFKIQMSKTKQDIPWPVELIDVTLKVNSDGILHVGCQISDSLVDLIVEEDKGRLSGVDIEKLLGHQISGSGTVKGRGQRPSVKNSVGVAQLTARFILLAMYGDSDNTKKHIDEERQKRKEREAIERDQQQSTWNEAQEKMEEEKAGQQEEERTVSESESGKKALVAKALFDFDARDTTEISFREGDLITHVVCDPSGWWFGRCKDQEGYFPYNYTELCS